MTIIRPIHVLPGVLALILATALLPLATSPARAASWTLRLEAGPHIGYTFAPDGAVTGSKGMTVTKPASVSADIRQWIGARGAAYYRLTTSTLAGYWVRESSIAYVPGMLVTKAFAPSAKVVFGAAPYLGYRFTADWKLASAKHAVLTFESWAYTSRRAMINGRPYAELTSGTWSGHWMPIAAPTTLTAAPLTCRRPAKIAAGSTQVFKVLPGGANEVALTFDMGGRIEPAIDILNRLIVEGVCSTLFPTGAMSQTAQGQQILAIVKAHPELFELGNHTMHHCNLRDGGGGSPTTAPCPTTAPTAAFIAKELTDAATILKAATGQEPSPYWRPPYGAYDTRVLNAAAAVGYTKVFLWDVDTIDWRPVADGGPTAAQIVSKVVTNATNGTDVLMHLGGWNTLDALPQMIFRLRGRGLTPTTISQILR